MPNIIDTQQLQATAQVVKSYILEQGTANVTTIINALQQGGGPTILDGVLVIGSESSTVDGSIWLDMED